MKKSDATNVFGAWTSIFLLIANLLHIIWTVWLISEQIDTGWGYSTNMEMGVLYPWLCELLCAPAFLAGIVFLIMNIWKHCEKWVSVSAGITFTCYFLQVFLTNLFIFF